MGFVRFVIDCFLSLFSYYVGSVNQTAYEKMASTHGAIGWLIYIVSFLFIKFYLYPRWKPNANGVSPIYISFVLMLCYFVFIYLFLI